jgi:hypothetical protein
MNQAHGGLCIRSALLFVIGSLLAPSMARAQTELITNGGFETGDLGGWTVETLGGLHLGSWRINDGTYVPPGPMPQAFPPLSGNFDAVVFQVGAGTKRLTSSPIAVPDSVSAASLSWLDSIRNFDFMGSFEDPGQEFRVLLLDANLVLIAEIYSTNPGDAPFQLGPNARQFDMTAALQSLAGQTVYLRFEVQDELFFFNVSVDDVSLLVDDGSGGGGGEVPMWIDVLLDIKPGSDENPVNLKVNNKSKGQSAAAGGVLPVAILGSPDYDVALVDAATLLLGDPALAGAALPIKWHLEDVNLDGLDDLVLHYSVLELVKLGAINESSIGLIVVGETVDGVLITGADSVSIVPANNKKNKQGTKASNKKSR